MSNNNQSYEVFLNSFTLFDNCNNKKETLALLSFKWEWPNSKNSLCQKSFAIKTSREPQTLNYEEGKHNFGDRILFKGGIDGRSSINFSIAHINDPGIYGKILKSMLNSAVEFIPLAFIRPSVKSIIDEIGFDKKKFSIFGEGFFQFDNYSDNNGVVTIELKTPKKIVYPIIDLDTGQDDDDWIDELGDDNYITIQKGETIAKIELEINQIAS